MEDNTTLAIENLQLRQLLRERDDETEHYKNLYKWEVQKRESLEEKISMLEAGKAELVARVEEEVKKKNALKTSRFVQMKRPLDTGDLATMKSTLYQALKADTIVKCPQKRVVFSPFGRECARELIQQKGEGDIVTYQNNKIEKVKSLEGTIGILLIPYQTIPENLSNRKKKEAKHLLTSYVDKIQKGYMGDHRDKFVKVAKELAELDSNVRPVGETLFKQIMNKLDSVTPVSNL